MVSLRFLGYLFLTSLICVLLGSAPIHADVKDIFKSLAKQKFIAKVRLNIRADDQILKGKVTSYISRELRSIGDVEIVDKEADWTLEVAVYEILDKSRKQLGISIVVVVLENYLQGALKYYISTLSGEEEKKKKIIEDTSNLTKYRNTIISTTSTDSVKSSCEELVALFDSKYLEESRNTHRIFQGIYKEISEEKPIQK